MFPDKLKLEIITPLKKIYSADVSSIRLPAVDGYLGVFPGHTPYLAALKIGEIKVVNGQETQYFATSGGVAEIHPGSVAVLAETAEPAPEIDVKRAKNAQQRAEKKLGEGRKTWDVMRAHIGVTRAMNRLQVSSRR